MLVCFDLGGVVVRICRDWREGCDAAGVPHRSFAPDSGHVEARQRLIGELQRGEVEDPEFHRRLSLLFDGLWSPSEIASIDEAWIRTPYPGVLELIRDLGRAGVETACLSNTSRDHWRTLRGLDEVSALDHRHASHLMGLVKPDDAIYARFETLVGRRPEEILFFDDLQANVDAAVRRGWVARRVDHLGDTARQMRTVLQDRGIL